jgi:hypothetical protein
MGPSKAIGSFTHERQSAHSRLSAADLMSSSGPIHNYSQLSSGGAMGPFKAIGCFSNERQWAPSRLSAFLSCAETGQFKAIGSFLHEQQWADSMLSTVFLMSSNWPTQGYRQL